VLVSSWHQATCRVQSTRRGTVDRSSSSNRQTSPLSLTICSVLRNPSSQTKQQRIARSSLYYAFHHTHSPQFSGQRFVNTSIRGPYGDSLREIDYSVGQILKTLKSLGLSNDTFIFLTSDNGPALENGVLGGVSGPLRCGKSSTWEGGLRVPGIAFWPGKIQHRRSAQLSSTLDLLPTIFNLAGA
ncbi:Arylsulfatase A, partial [Geodia barretti]